MKSYNKFYYEKNKDKILIKQEAKALLEYRNFHGHVEAIHDPIRRYASQWHIKIDSLKLFKRWSFNDVEYENLFKAWETSGFEKNLSPVVMRKIKKRGFVIDNLYWSTKGAHNWWSGILDDIKNLGKDMETRQIKNNKSTEEEMQERIDALRAKKKSK